MIVYLIIVLSFCALYPLIPRKHIKWLFLALVLALSVMAFNCKPLETDDLSRYYVTLNTLRDCSFSQYLDLQADGYGHFDAAPVCGLYFFLISKLPENRFLPAVTIFIVYGGMFMILWRIAEKYKISKWYLFMGSFFLLCTYWYYDTCSGIRNGLAFGVFIVCVYFELMEKRKKIFCWIGYAAAIGVHPAAVILLAVRVLSEISMRSNSSLINAITVIGIGFGASVIEILGKIFDNAFISLLLEKTESNANRMIEFGPTTILNIILLIMMSFLYFYARHLLEKYGIDEDTHFFKFFGTLLVFTFGSLTSSLIFVRLMHWVVPMLGSVIIMIGLEMNKNERNNRYAINSEKSIIKANRSLYRTNERILNLVFLAFSVLNLYFLCFMSTMSAAVFSFN